MAKEKGVKRWIVLDPGKIKWLTENYPSHSLSWVVDKVLSSFIMVHDRTPIELANKAGNYMKEEVVNEKNDKAT